MRAHLAGAVIVTTFVLLTLGHYALAAAKLRLQVQPRQTIIPIHEWHLRVWCPRDPSNRVLRVEAHGDDYDRATEMQLDGEAAPAVFEVWWKGFVPCGDYAITASVWTNTGAHQVTQDTAHICASVDPQP